MKLLDRLLELLRGGALRGFWLHYAVLILGLLSFVAAVATFATTLAFFSLPVALVVGCSVGLLSMVESAAALTICFVIQEVTCALD